MIGNEFARKQVISWIKNWKKGEKPLLIIGPPGTGKTSLVRALANDFGFYVYELNASDVRTKEKLESSLSNISAYNLYGQRILVFLDEVDGIFSREDKGGIEYISKFIEDSKVPVIMAANYEKDSMREIIKKSILIEFKRIPNREIELLLGHIARSESIQLSYDRLQTIVKESNGDVRYAINQMQAGTSEPTYKDVELTAEEAIKGAMRSESVYEAIRFLNRWDADPEVKLTTVAATVLSSEPEDMAERLKWLSSADILLARIKRLQEWRLLRYLSAMLASALIGLKGNYNEYLMPYAVINEMRKRPIYQSLTERMMQELHVGRGEAASMMVPLYEFLVKRGIVSDEELKKAIS